MAVEPGSSSSISGAPRLQQKRVLKQQGEYESATEEGVFGSRDARESDDADEIPAPGSSVTPMTATTPVTETYDGDDEQSNDTAAADSPFLVFSSGTINVRRQGGHKELGLNCATPTRPKHGDDWIGDLFSRGRLTRSRRTRDDTLLELSHENVAQRRLQDEDEDEGEDDEDDASRGRGGESPVTPRSQFGRWKYGLMMSQSTMKPPKLSQEDDTVAVKRNVNDEEDGDSDGGSEDGDDDTHWPFGDEQVGSDPSTPKRRPSKIPQGHFMSPTTPTFQDSGCDDNDVEDEEEDEDVGSDQDGNTTKNEDQFPDSPSGSQLEQRLVNEHNDNGVGSSMSSNAINQDRVSGMKPPKLNLKHLGGGIPSSPSEISSSFHTPPRKRSRNELDDYGSIGRPPPAPKLISPEHALQYYSSSESPSVLRSLQLRRIDGSSSYKRSPK
ncbi:hypothetical protein EC991_009139 [Linnemannia zychae]|nr:hypothetical protein EC991_009139 [Linnemannia zychae]